MKSGKGFGEAVRRVVAEFQRDVDDLPVRREDLQPGGGEPALADVVAHRHTAQHGKSLLEVEGGQGRLLRDLPDGQLLPEMFLDILDRLMNACYPIHWSHRPSDIQHTGELRPLPDFLCLCLSGPGILWPMVSLFRFGMRSYLVVRPPL